MSDEEIIPDDLFEIPETYHIPNEHWLYGEVGPKMLFVVSKALRAAGGKPVTFRLCSEGGDEDSGLAIYDLISGYKGKTTIQVEGSAQSMAAVVFQAAKIRTILANSFIMIHSGDLEVESSHKKNIKSYIKMVEWQDDICDEIVLARIQKKHPKYSWSKFRKETNFDVYFTADQALRWGLVDRVVK